jgi:hypothetical protein
MSDVEGELEMQDPSEIIGDVIAIIIIGLKMKCISKDALPWLHSLLDRR